MNNLEFEQLLFRYKDKKIEIIENNGKYKIVIKEVIFDKEFFGFHITRYKTIIQRIIKFDTEIDYIVDYKKYAWKGFCENPTNKKILDLLHMSMGYTSEAAEVQDTLKKFVFHSKEYDKSSLLDEIGDSVWYLFNMITLLDINFKDVLISNMIKLDSRYPNGREKNYFLNKRNKEQEKKKIKEYIEAVDGHHDDKDMSIHNKENLKEKSL